MTRPSRPFLACVALLLVLIGSVSAFLLSPTV